MKLLAWSGLALLTLALLAEPAWADIRPPDYPLDHERSTGNTLATIAAGLAVTAALIFVGLWLARRSEKAATEQPAQAASQPAALEAQPEPSTP